MLSVILEDEVIGLSLDQQENLKDVPYIAIRVNHSITDEMYIIDLGELPNDLKDIFQYLKVLIMDEKFRQQLKAEEEIDDIFNEQEAKELEKQANICLNKAILIRYKKGEKEKEIARYFEMSIK